MCTYFKKLLSNKNAKVIANYYKYQYFTACKNTII